MELFYEKRDGYSILIGCFGEAEHVEIASCYADFPVLEIGPGVFKDHQELLTVEVPMLLQRIGEDCFRNCENLTCICTAESDTHSVLPPALLYVGDRAFENTSLRIVTFTSPYLTLGKYAFRNSGVKDIVFHDATKVNLEEGVFMRCSDLEYVSYFKAGIDGLPMHCFAHCTSLRKILADYLTGAIGAGAFYECAELEALPIDKPLDYVGEGAFAGCKLKTDGFYRTLRDALNGLGDTLLVNEIVKRKTARCTWGPRKDLEAYAKHIEEVGQEVLRELHSVPRSKGTNMVLIKAVGSVYYNPYDGFDYIERFYVFHKNDILDRFKPIADFDITCEWDWVEMKPPMRDLDSLSREEVLRLLMCKISPTPQPYTWDRDLGRLLDAELAGDAAFYQVSLATDFLTKLIDHKLHPDREGGPQDIPNEQLAECFPEDSSFTDKEKLHELKWSILYNRIQLYFQLLSASFQLNAAQFNQRRR